MGNPWKDDTKGDNQSLLFYVNVIYGLSFLPIALMNISRDGEKFFLSYFFEGDAIQERNPINWVSRNCALGFTGLSIAMITAPQNTGVSVVGFFICLLPSRCSSWASPARSSKSRTSPSGSGSCAPPPHSWCSLLLPSISSTSRTTLLLGTGAMNNPDLADN